MRYIYVGNVCVQCEDFSLNESQIRFALNHYYPESYLMGMASNGRVICFKDAQCAIEDKEYFLKHGSFAANHLQEVQV